MTNGCARVAEKVSPFLCVSVEIRSASRMFKTEPAFTVTEAAAGAGGGGGATASSRGCSRRITSGNVGACGSLGLGASTTVGTGADVVAAWRGAGEAGGGCLGATFGAGVRTGRQALTAGLTGSAGRASCAAGTDSLAGASTAILASGRRTATVSLRPLKNQAPEPATPMPSANANSSFSWPLLSGCRVIESSLLRPYYI